MSTNLHSLSGTILRTLVVNGNTSAQTELSRCQAKRAMAGKVTVVALRSWGHTSEADTLIAQAKASKAAKPKATSEKPPAPSGKAGPTTPVVRAPEFVGFTRTGEIVSAPKSATAHLHNQVVNVEKALLELAVMARAQNELLSLLTAKLLAQA